MKLIVALGNPGDKYYKTRHNAGFLFADRLVNKWSCSFNFESKFNAEVAKCNYNNEPVWVIKPMTFMNLSGNSVREILHFYKYSPQDVFVVYDDIALNVGVLRFRSSGSDGGHNGIKSIISNLGTNKFDRLKIGIGPQPPMMPSESYVLQSFSEEQYKELNSVLDRAVEATESYLKDGLLTAQTKFNSK